MSKSEDDRRGNKEPAQRSGWLKRFGVWAGVVTVTTAAITVFALCACKSAGSRW